MSETTAPLSSFERMLRRAATERERDQLRRVQAELGLRENDALWLVIFALQYYEGCPASAPLRQIGGVEERRISGSS